MSQTPLDPSGMPNLGVANYSHGIVSEGATKWLHASGQVGLLPSGETADGALAQSRAAFSNIRALLVGGGFEIEDICHLRMFLVDRADLAAVREARSEFFGDKVVASTLVFVAGLADPAWKVELEVVASR